MHRGKLVMFFVVTTLVLGLLPGTAHAADAAASQRSNATSIADLVDRHNATRRSHGLSPLRFSPTISAGISQPWTMSMAERNNLSHNSDFGWPGANRWAENVAYTSTSKATAHLMEMWLDSPGHRQNIMNPDYTVIAVGVVKQNGLTWSTANFYAGSLRNAGTLYNSGEAWLRSLDDSNGSSTPHDSSSPDDSTGDDSNSVDVYTTPGTHTVNGRRWRTACVPYSQTKRCTTEIWSTRVVREGGRFVSRNGWAFNNLTYLPSSRSLWKNNNLGKNANWTVDGRRWRTECDTAVTGRNGCRSYIWGTVVVSTETSSGYRYSTANQWIFNNMVHFS